MKGKKTLISFIVIVLLIGGIPAAFAGFQPGTGETTKINLYDAADPTATPVTYPDGQQYIELNDTYDVGESFTVYANVTSVTELNMYQVGVEYDPSILDVTSFSEGSASESFFYLNVPPAAYAPIINKPIPASGAGGPMFGGDWEHITWALVKPYNASGTGILAKFEFTVVGWGFTYIDIMISGAQVAVIADPTAPPDENYNTIDIIFDNLGLAPPAHELTVSVEAPETLEPGDSSLLNATVSNIGLNNETDVELQLMINGTVFNNVTIPKLVNGTSYTIDYSWTPTVEATYNITAYAVPVSGESDTDNNVATKDVVVQTQVHELEVSVEAPETLEVGDSSLLNATVSNLGSVSETNVELQLLINGTVKESETITELLAGSSYTIDYLWTPTVEATYNITAYAVPVSGETDTDNNVTYVQAQVIPEFPAAMFLLLFMMVTLVVVILVKSTKRRKAIGK